jgi:hypothetical protein
VARLAPLPSVPPSIRKLPAPVAPEVTAEPAALPLTLEEAQAALL